MDYSHFLSLWSLANVLPFPSIHVLGAITFHIDEVASSEDTCSVFV